jgi:formylglycine-generating enzyme required for sulfatase activity
MQKLSQPQFSNLYAKKHFIYLLITSLLIFGGSIRSPCQDVGQIMTQAIPGTEISFELALIPAGTFRMKNATTGQEIEITVDSFWMGVHEVTFDEYALFEHRENDSDAAAGEDGLFSADAVTRPTPQYLDFTYGMGKAGGYPAVSMTQQAALRYCYWLYQKTGHFYRLPTEAEWEYACRNGSVEAPVSKEALEKYAWYYDNSNEKYQKTGQKQPNTWGIYDMLGNVAEWTLDEYVDNYADAIRNIPANPWLKPSRRHSRTVKGGSYEDFAENCHCGARQKSQPRWQARDPQIPKSLWWNTDSPFVGFRIIRPLKELSAQAVEEFFKTAVKD